jgi:hypothetical protein
MLNLRDIRGFYLATALSLILLFALTASAGDDQKSAYSKPKATPTQYLVEIPHTVEECLASLDETKALGQEKLNQWTWGCVFGNHTAYCIVNAKSETEALANVPSAERAKAKVFPLTKFTVQQIESFHAAHE